MYTSLQLFYLSIVAKHQLFSYFLSVHFLKIVVYFTRIFLNFYVLKKMNNGPVFPLIMINKKKYMLLSLLVGFHFTSPLVFLLCLHCYLLYSYMPYTRELTKLDELFIDKDRAFDYINQKRE